MSGSRYKLFSDHVRGEARFYWIVDARSGKKVYSSFNVTRARARLKKLEKQGG